jgi:hypothetical protein
VHAEYQDVVVTPKRVEGGLLVLRTEAIDDARLDHQLGRVGEAVDLDGGQGGGVDFGGQVVGDGRPSEGGDRAQDDISSVAYWYQTLPTAPFPELPDRDYLEII